VAGKIVILAETSFLFSQAKSQLLEISSFSGPPDRVFNGCFLSVSRERVSARVCLFQEMFFRQTAILFHTVSSFSYILFFLKHAKTHFSENLKFRPVYSRVEGEESRKKCVFGCFRKEKHFPGGRKE